VFYKYNAKQRNYQYDVKSGSIINGYIDGFHLLDASLAKSFFSKTLSVTAGLKNILNVININANIPSGIHTTGSNNASIAMGRTFFISCAYNLSWN
jgi:outer membrane receptor for ferrienterochelin and colicins